MQLAPHFKAPVSQQNTQASSVGRKENEKAINKEGPVKQTPQHELYDRWNISYSRCVHEYDHLTVLHTFKVVIA